MESRRLAIFNKKIQIPAFELINIRVGCGHTVCTAVASLPHSPPLHSLLNGVWQAQVSGDRPYHVSSTLHNSQAFFKGTQGEAGKNKCSLIVCVCVRV